MFRAGHAEEFFSRNVRLFCGKSWFVFDPKLVRMQKIKLAFRVGEKVGAAPAAGFERGPTLLSVLFVFDWCLTTSPLLFYYFETIARRSHPVLPRARFTAFSSTRRKQAHTRIHSAWHQASVGVVLGHQGVKNAREERVHTTKQTRGNIEPKNTKQTAFSLRGGIYAMPPVAR